MRTNPFWRPCLLVLIALVLPSLQAACSAPAPPVPVVPTATQMLLASPSASLNTSATPTRPAPTLPATPTPTQIPLRICSPLADLEISSLPQAISNPYNPPPLGSDDPHEGVDLAVLSPGTGIALPGAPVRAVLPGKVAAVLVDRFPYGNAVIIETPLSDLPPGWSSALPLPQPVPTLAPHRSLTCPQAGFQTDWLVEPRSLYLIYAHLLETPAHSPGDLISCAETLGAVGASGNALNPHLHLEARVGPSGVRFASLAHYDSSATPLEMETYCVWRVSGWFQLFDPMTLFTPQN